MTYSKMEQLTQIKRLIAGSRREKLTSQISPYQCAASYWSINVFVVPKALLAHARGCLNMIQYFSNFR